MIVIFLSVEESRVVIELINTVQASRLYRMMIWRQSLGSLKTILDIHCSKYLKEHCIFCHRSQYKCTHSLYHRVELIKLGKNMFVL